MLNNYLPDDRRLWKNWVSLHVSIIECAKQNKFQIILGSSSLHIWSYVVFMVKAIMKRDVTTQVTNTPQDLKKLPVTLDWYSKETVRHYVSHLSSVSAVLLELTLFSGGAAENRMWLERDEYTESLGHNEGECGSSFEWKYHSESLLLVSNDSTATFQEHSSHGYQTCRTSSRVNLQQTGNLL